MVKIMVPNPIEMDDLGVPLFSETPIYLPEVQQLAPENGWLEDDPFLLGAGNFSGAMLNFGSVDCKDCWQNNQIMMFAETYR